MSFSRLDLADSVLRIMPYWDSTSRFERSGVETDYTSSRDGSHGM